MLAMMASIGRRFPAASFNKEEPLEEEDADAVDEAFPAWISSIALCTSSESTRRSANLRESKLYLARLTCKRLAKMRL